MKKAKFKYNFIGIFIILSFHLNAQTSKMERNYNKIPFKDSITKDVKEQFKKINNSKKEILLIAKKLNDSLFSIFLYNNTKDSLNIELQNRSLFLIQEAKNKNGEWEPIEYQSLAACANSYHSYKIKSKEIIRTDSKSYQGDFQTKIRFKLNHNDKIFYSNSLPSGINENQFVIPKNLTKDRLYGQYLDYGGKKLLKKVIFIEKNYSKEIGIQYQKWKKEIERKRAEYYKNKKK